MRSNGKGNIETREPSENKKLPLQVSDVKMFTFLREMTIGVKVFDAVICSGEMLVTAGCRGSATLNLTDACLDVTRSLIMTSTLPALIEGTLMFNVDLNPYADGDS